MSVDPIAFRRFLCTALVAAFLLLMASQAFAAGCPTKPVAEHGGEHWCYSAGKRGNVHLWKPAGYDRDTAVTVVYVHGHNLGLENCANAHYLDCAWDAHGLAKQFAASGLSALFVAVEGPVNDGQKPKWKSLDALMDSIGSDGGLKPPAKVVAVAHSAGMFTVMRFLDDDRLAHVVALDALYLDSPARIATWFGSAESGRRLTLVGADAVHARTTKLGAKLGCDTLGDLGAAYPRSARCVAAVVVSVAHMAVVTGAQAIPHALARMTAAPPPKVAKARGKRAKKPPRT